MKKYYVLDEVQVDDTWYYTCIEMENSLMGCFKMLQDEVVFFLETIAQQSKARVQYCGLNDYFCWRDGQLVCSIGY